MENTVNETQVVKVDKKIKARYAVTFEFNVKQPVTIRGEVIASSPHTCAQRAVIDSKKQIKAKSKENPEYNIIGWTSFSVLIDRG